LILDALCLPVISGFIERETMKSLVLAIGAALAFALMESPADAQGALSTAQTEKIAKDAYVYGYSLVTTELTRLAAINTAGPNPKTLQAPMNNIANVPGYPPATYKGVTAPNADTLYTFGFFDLSKEPMIFSYPNMGKRFFLFPMYDEWTDVVGVPGTRTMGGAAQKILLSGPSWHGAVPSGMRQIKMPTNIMFMIGRVYCDGSAADLAAVHALQAQFKIVPLGKLGQAYIPPAGTPGSKYSPKDVVRDVIASWSTSEYFNFMTKAMVDNPPVLPRDAAIVAEMAKIGLAPGEPFDTAKLNPQAQKALANLPKAIVSQLGVLKKSGGTVANGWLIPGAAGSYGTNYAARAAVSAFGWGANLAEDAIYPYAPGGNSPALDGAHTYKVHFAKGMTPPAKGFWSITMYDDHFYFYPNAFNKLTVSLRNHPKFNEDGSLDLYFSHAQPPGVLQSNWLPAPAAAFILMMRIYWPNPNPPSILNKSWVPPAVVRVK
jgi:hypothetical protein